MMVMKIQMDFSRKHFHQQMVDIGPLRSRVFRWHGVVPSLEATQQQVQKLIHKKLEQFDPFNHYLD